LISGDLEYIKTAPEAAFNIISCPTWGIPLAKSMKEHFGTQYSKQSVPVGISATKKWLREIAILSGKVEQAEKFINEEIKQLESLFNKTKNFTKGVIALIECGRNSQTAFARPMALARALEELEMIPVLFGLHPLELKAKQVDYEYFMSEKFDPIILNGNYAYQQSININHIIEDLGLKDYIYFTQDIFPLSRAGIFDETRVPRVETSVHLRRIINAPGRGIGFTGSKALYESILESLKISSKKSKSTLYARVHGKFYEKF
jgi:nitrogenase molybdenum-iron protein alpha/beta subunit